MKPWVLPISRIVARYAAGLLAGFGLMSYADGQDIAGDPDVLLVVAAVISGLTELIYVEAKKRGWG